jgi:D-3-phosphoglycerate dehydrogenase
VVVAEPFAEIGIDVLRRSGIEVASRVGASRAELIEALAEADGLIVRSETRVDRELLAAGPRLMVVGRAGVGVDAIDVEAATKAGVIVLNTPEANTIAATEQTFALMLSLARRTPDAVNSVRQGLWIRQQFIGTELYGKTLGIVGLGRIGGNIALRAKAFGMTILAHDPFISPARADAFGAKLVELDELLARSDIVTLHVPLTPQTRGMIDGAKLARMQRHAYLINCARGGVIVEEDLIKALDDGTIAGAGIDVVAVEPPPPDGSGAKLHKHPKVYATPHLGGSTHEALARIATELAEDVARVLNGAPANGVVNAPIADGPDAARLRPFIDVAYRLGKFYPQFATESRLPTFVLAMQGAIAQMPADAVITAFLSGLLQATTDRKVTVVNAQAIAQELGVRVETAREPSANQYAASVQIRGGNTTVTGTVVNGSPRIVEADGFEIDAIPEGAMLITQHADVPGVIGKVGTILGNANINIASMQVSRNEIGGKAIMVLTIDKPVEQETLEVLRSTPWISSVRSLSI